MDKKSEKEIPLYKDGDIKDGEAAFNWFLIIGYSISGLVDAIYYGLFGILVGFFLEINLVVAGLCGITVGLGHNFLDYYCVKKYGDGLGAFLIPAILVLGLLLIGTLWALSYFL